jgi:hypothetical protein
MGSVSTPGVPKLPAPATPPPGGEGSPLAGDGPLMTTQPTRRIKLPEKRMPLGPRLSTILGVSAAVAGLVWFLLRPPKSLPVVTLPKYVAFEASLEQGSPLDCRTKGCLLVIVGTGSKTQGAIPSVVEMARDLEGRGVETTFVVSGDALKECARVAHLFHRPVLLDPDAQLQKALGISLLPCWVVHDPAGRIRHLSEEPMTGDQVVREAGL